MTVPEAQSLLIFDSGLGGLSLIPAIRKSQPERHLIYMADNALFPYGDLSEDDLSSRLVILFKEVLNKQNISTVVIACNTASTVTLEILREEFPLPFVGTVPAIKPACTMTQTGLVSVLATPGTVSRGYTQQLIKDFARGVEVTLHGSAALAKMTEDKLSGKAVDLGLLAQEIEPVFRTGEKGKTDVVVLGCTHYPLMKDEMISASPWPVTFLDTSEAIARRLGAICSPNVHTKNEMADRVILTQEGAHLTGVFKTFGFEEFELLSV